MQLGAPTFYGRRVRAWAALSCLVPVRGGGGQGKARNESPDQLSEEGGRGAEGHGRREWVSEKGRSKSNVKRPRSTDEEIGNMPRAIQRGGRGGGLHSGRDPPASWNLALRSARNPEEPHITVAPPRSCCRNLAVREDSRRIDYHDSFTHQTTLGKHEWRSCEAQQAASQPARSA